MAKKYSNRKENTKGKSDAKPNSKVSMKLGIYEVNPKAKRFIGDSQHWDQGQIIPFRFADTLKEFNGKNSTGQKVEVVEFTIRISIEEDSSRTNTNTVSINVITDFVHQGVDYIVAVKKLQESVYPSFATEDNTMSKRWAFFERILRGNALTNYHEAIRSAAKAIFAPPDGPDFSQMAPQTIWETTLDEELSSGVEYTKELERRINLTIRKMMWVQPHTAYHSFINYFMHGMAKPFDMKALEFYNKVNTLASWIEFLLPPHQLADEYHHINWERLRPLSDEEIRQGIFNAMPLGRKRFIEAKDTNYQTVSNHLFLNYLTQSEDQDTRSTMVQNKRFEPSSSHSEGEEKEKKSVRFDSRTKKSSSKSGIDPKRSRRHCVKCEEAKRADHIIASHDTKDCKFRSSSNERRFTQKDLNKLSKQVTKQVLKMKRSKNKTKKSRSKKESRHAKKNSSSSSSSSSSCSGLFSSSSESSSSSSSNSGKSNRRMLRITEDSKRKRGNDSSPHSEILSDDDRKPAAKKPTEIVTKKTKLDEESTGESANSFDLKDSPKNPSIDDTKNPSIDDTKNPSIDDTIMDELVKPIDLTDESIDDTPKEETNKDQSIDDTPKKETEKRQLIEVDYSDSEDASSQSSGLDPKKYKLVPTHHLVGNTWVPVKPGYDPSMLRKNQRRKKNLRKRQQAERDERYAKFYAAQAAKSNEAKEDQQSEETKIDQTVKQSPYTGRGVATMSTDERSQWLDDHENDNFNLGNRKGWEGK